MKAPITFEILKELPDGALGRAGRLTTPHGVIETPAFVPVATKATIKGVLPDQMKQLGAQVLFQIRITCIWSQVMIVSKKRVDCIRL